MESNLFNCVQYTTQHVLYQLLPPVKDAGYNLRQRSHHRTLPSTDNNFIRKIFYIECCLRTFAIDVVHSISTAFLADRTNGRAYATVLRLSSSSSSSVTLCIVAKRCVLEQNLLLRAYRKSYIRNRLVPK